jgi:DNA-binding transcriptional MerR regulator
VNRPAQFLKPSEAAKRLGVSAKALLLYEQRGLIAPIRTDAGWRAYGPKEMARAAEIAVLRVLGLSLGQVERVLGGDPRSLQSALATHQATLEGQMRHLADTADKVRGVRAALASGQTSTAGDLTHLLKPTSKFRVVFDLPCMGRRTIRTARYPATELHHRPTGQR